MSDQRRAGPCPIPGSPDNPDVKSLIYLMMPLAQGLLIPIMDRGPIDPESTPAV